MKTERIQLLVNVTICYDPQTKGERAHMIRAACEDVRACNTLPNEATSARPVKPKRPTS